MDGTTIDVCHIYNYLGLPTLSSKVVIRRRFAASWSAIGELRPIIQSTAPDALKIKLFKSAVETIAAYALESLPLNPTTSNMLDAVHRQMIRAAFGINWRNNTTNDEAYAISGLLQFSQTIRKKKTSLDRPLVASTVSNYHTTRVNAAKPYRRILVTPWIGPNEEFGEGFAQRSERN